LCLIVKSRVSGYFWGEGIDFVGLGKTDGSINRSLAVCFSGGLAGTF
jgi:hypothetical protein